jgi:hypothetical protein
MGVRVEAERLGVAELRFESVVMKSWGPQSLPEPGRLLRE